MKKLMILLLIMYSCDEPPPQKNFNMDTFSEYLAKGQINGSIALEDTKYMNEFLRIEKTGRIDSMFIFMDKFKEYVTAGVPFKF